MSADGVVDLNPAIDRRRTAADDSSIGHDERQEMHGDHITASATVNEETSALQSRGDRGLPERSRSEDPIKRGWCPSARAKLRFDCDGTWWVSWQANPAGCTHTPHGWLLEQLDSR